MGGAKKKKPWTEKVPVGTRLIGAVHSHSAQGPTPGLVPISRATGRRINLTWMGCTLEKTADTTSTQKGSPHPQGLNKEPSCCEETVLTTAPPKNYTRTYTYRRG